MCTCKVAIGRHGWMILTYMCSEQLWDKQYRIINQYRDRFSRNLYFVALGVGVSVFVENVWPAHSALFVYVSTHFDETVKWFDYNRYSQLTWRCSGNASALGASRPGFNPRLRQGFLCLIICFVVVVFLLFLSKTHYLSQNCAIPFTILINLVYLTYCEICDQL